MAFDICGKPLNASGAFCFEWCFAWSDVGNSSYYAGSLNLANCAMLWKQVETVVPVLGVYHDRNSLKCTNVIMADKLLFMLYACLC